MKNGFEELDRLQTKLKKLKTAYEQFISGLERLEPLRMKDDFERDMRRVATAPLNNTAWKFRLNSIRTNYLTNLSRWSRIARQIEEGTFHRDVEKAKKRTSSNATAPASARPEAQADPLDQLHQEFTNARASLGMKGMVSKEALAKTVSQQRQALKERFKCDDVGFKVTIKNGKPILTAHPIRGNASS